MRPSALLLAAAIPSACALQPRSIAQAPLVVSEHSSASTPYEQWHASNGTIESITSQGKTSREDSINSSTTPSNAAISAEIPSPALEKSMFSLIVFGIAGLCLL
ncbi:hypothetical protein BX600DRAFT_431221 [Xylariales sp. PMI_506]|nr:hypothetical protein BX600DRAFT_431221 [Xylariales sp. PMI_506]